MNRAGVGQVFIDSLKCRLVSRFLGYFAALVLPDSGWTSSVRMSTFKMTSSNNVKCVIYSLITTLERTTEMRYEVL